MQTVVAKDDENAQRHKTDFNKKTSFEGPEDDSAGNRACWPT